MGKVEKLRNVKIRKESFNAAIVFFSSLFKLMVPLNMSKYDAGEHNDDSC